MNNFQEEYINTLNKAQHKLVRGGSRHRKFLLKCSTLYILSDENTLHVFVFRLF